MKHSPLHEVLELSDSGVWGSEDAANGVNVLRSTNFNADGTLDLSKLALRAVDPRKRDSKLLQNGDILLEKSGGGPAQPVGRVCLFRGDDRTHSFGNFIARLRPSRTILPEYLFYFLWHFHAIGMTNHYQKQTTGIRNLEFKRYLTIQVPIPPLNEQRRIVDVLSRAEGIVRLCREAERKAAELIPAIFLDMFGDPAANPKRWPMAGIESLCSVQTGATPHRKEFRYFDSGTIPWIKTTLVTGDPIASAGDYITESAVAETNCKIFPVGTILVAMYGQGQTRGRVGIIEIAAATNQACAAILPSDKISREFLFHALRIQYQRLRAMGRGGNQANLNLSMIKELEVPLPPLDLQRQFAAKAEAVRGIAARQTAALATAQATFDALLHRAFTDPHGAGA